MPQPDKPVKIVMELTLEGIGKKVWPQSRLRDPAPAQIKLSRVGGHMAHLNGNIERPANLINKKAECAYSRLQLDCYLVYKCQIRTKTNIMILIEILAICCEGGAWNEQIQF